MSLPKAKTGDLLLFFQIYQNASKSWTLGDPEKFIWSSIKHLSSRSIISDILKDVYGISIYKTRLEVAKNVRQYINQAFEFYEVASLAKGNTAPLLYYYSFLNLGKAICEINNPEFHKTQENYWHGIKWNPSKDYLVHIPTEYVIVTKKRGVWHVIWESVFGRPLSISQGSLFKIKDLLSLCPELYDQFDKTFGEDIKIVELLKPEIYTNSIKNKYWINFSISRSDLKDLQLPRTKFLQLLSKSGNVYRQVHSAFDNVWTFEFKDPKNFPPKYKGDFYDIIIPEIKNLNIFTYLSPGRLNYSVPIQTGFPLMLPQLMVLYSLFFWLGSLVRYDPHSVYSLQDSEYWILIDGLMNQSRIWLLELFEWELYKWETTLLSAR